MYKHRSKPITPLFIPEMSTEQIVHNAWSTLLDGDVMPYR
jgi:hypothetical protein